MTGLEQALKYVRQIKNIEAEIQKITLLVENIVDGNDYKITFKAEPISKKIVQKVAQSTEHPEYPQELPKGVGQVYLMKGNFGTLGDVLRGYVGANHPQKEEKKEADIRINIKMLCEVCTMFTNSMVLEKKKLQDKLDKLIRKEGSDKIVELLLKAYYE